MKTRHLTRRQPASRQLGMELTGMENPAPCFVAWKDEPRWIEVDIDYSSEKLGENVPARILPEYVPEFRGPK